MCSPRKSKLGTMCSAVGCSMRRSTNLLSTVKMYRFPTNPSRRLQWEAALQRKNWKANPKSAFWKPSSDAEHPDYVPSIFASMKNKGSSSFMNRYNRQIKRREVRNAPLRGLGTFQKPKIDENIDFSIFSLKCSLIPLDTSAIGNYILVDFNQVNNLLRSAKCQYCEKQTLKLELGAKLGFSYNLKLLCSNCDENKTVVNTSLKSVQTSHDVNLRITQAFSHIGKGYSAIEKFCMVMNIDPFSSTTYGKCARRLDNAYTLASENIFEEIHREIKNVYENGAEITNLSVSFDGTWLTRGHTSLIGVGCVIDMLTGYVVDFEVMSKVCRHCSVTKNKLGQSSAEFSIWYEGHKSECDINHLGSSTSMEMEAALTLWKRSTSLGFRYITVLSDGDCKTFNYLCEKKKCMDLTL
ncbi:uncharacterized protein TNCV_4905331 [Trichonephila clavipes]|uniref:Uncharacterized protein n=1 Tax=Trichonephila clavipes TaxID=2585209 RepID=A0A8X6RRU2_TRICX|nr:uncharacterized protein TNCV_4905331 [Trichonephila clavipes]